MPSRKGTGETEAHEIAIDRVPNRSPSVESALLKDTLEFPERGNLD
jgi:hypothetical protein